MDEIVVRVETISDIPAVHRINELAFQGIIEADLVDVVRAAATPIVSLVAVHHGKVVGHILFSPVHINEEPSVRAMGLAPMAVLPEYQRRGIGTALVNQGLQACRTLGCELVVVVGHPRYYPRFGFTPASRLNLRSEYDVPDEAFMALELSPGAAKTGGLVRYHQAFGST